MTDKYLQTTDDGLIMRDSQDYAKDKLTILNGYISRFTTSMRNKKWRALNYIDLQAGPGKNRFDPSGDIGLGSPLIALTTHIRLVTIFLSSYKMKSMEFWNKECKLATFIIE